MKLELVNIYTATLRRDELAAKLLTGDASESERAELREIDQKIHATREFAERWQIDSLLSAGFAHGGDLMHPAFPGDEIRVWSFDKVALDGEVLALLEATGRLTRKHNLSARVADWRAADQPAAA